MLHGGPLTYDMAIDIQLRRYFGDYGALYHPFLELF